MLQCLNLMSVKQYILYKAFIFIYKVKIGIYPAYLGEKLLTVDYIHKHNTRSKYNFYVGKYNKANTNKRLFTAGLIKFNSLPEEIKKL